MTEYIYMRALLTIKLIEVQFLRKRFEQHCVFYFKVQSNQVREEKLINKMEAIMWVTNLFLCPTSFTQFLSAYWYTIVMVLLFFIRKIIVLLWLKTCTWVWVLRICTIWWAEKPKKENHQMTIVWNSSYPSRSDTDALEARYKKMHLSTGTTCQILCFNFRDTIFSDIS